MNLLSKHIVRSIHQLLFFICIFCFSVGLADADSTNTVDHKNTDLHFYLDLIRHNIEEKTGILPYIKGSKNGVFLEVGTGGDPIAKMLSQIPPTSNAKIIACDIDPGIIESLPARHPILQDYLHTQNGPQLELLCMNAKNMHCFDDNYFDAINASSVVHEIVSYSGGINGLIQFFQEAHRTLKHNGALVYRDPEPVYNRSMPIVCSIERKEFKLLTHLFLYKFIDTRGSSLASSGRKFCLYTPQDVTFMVYKKNELCISELTYDDYLALPSHSIDFNREYIIKVPYGLYREIERHFLTYLHQCNPLVYTKLIPSLDKEAYFVHYLAQSTEKKLHAFFATKNQSFAHKTITQKQKIKLEQHIDKKSRAIEFGIPLDIQSTEKLHELYRILKQHSFDSSLYITHIDENILLLDYRIFGLLYTILTETIFDAHNKPVYPDDTIHAEWLKREAEESYFYLSPDELITTVLKNTQRPEEENGTISVLCPKDPSYNKFIPRLCYSSLLEESLRLKNNRGYSLQPKDGKRIIHFCKIPLGKALSICDDIINKDPHSYPKLADYIGTLKKEKI